MGRQDSGGFQVGESGDPSILQLTGAGGAPVDLFAQLAKVREQLAVSEAPPVATVRSPAVDPRRKPTAAAEDEPSGKRQRTDQEQGAEAAAEAENSDDAAAAAADDAGAGDLFAQLAKLQQAQAAAGTPATTEETSAPDPLGGASDPVGGPSVDQWNGADGGIDMGFEVLP